MPHFSKSSFKTKQTLSPDREYRATAYVNMRTPWDDNTGRYQPMTQDQRNVCERLHKELHAAGVEIGVTIAERSQALEVKDFPKVAFISLFVNEPKEQSEQIGSVVKQTYDAPAPNPLATAENSSGWD
tara:strand:+ start:321 stop:704 length:384 start_codon:yes stop_codon:yes gene_type:complete